MVYQSFFSVVRLLVTVLFLLMLSACTAQYTREVSRSTLRDMGWGTSVKITRTGSWALPEGTAVHLVPTSSVGADLHAYPRLSSHLDRLLESIASEWFHSAEQRSDAILVGSGAESGVRLQLSLAAAVDRLSSVREVANHSTQTEEASGRDRLHLVMKVYDARSGQLLDTLTGEAVSGWRWGEQSVAELAEPTLRVMLARLRGAASIE